MHYLIYSIIYFLGICILIRIYHFFYVRSQNFAFFWLVSIVICISSFRCNFGSDYYQYYRMYNHLNDQIAFYGIKKFFEQDIQIGFPILMNITKQIFSSEYAIFWTSSLIIYPGIFYWIYKNSNHSTFSFVLFFLLGLFDITNNCIKQSISLVFILYAYDFLLDKKYFIFIILVCIAAFFHISSILMSALMLISICCSLKRIHIFIFFILGIISILIYNNIFNILDTKIFSRYMRYSDGRILSIPFFSATIIYTIFFIYISNIFVKSKFLNNIDRIRVNLIIISIFFSVLSFKYIVIIRMCYFALMQIIILLPKSIENNLKLKSISKSMILNIVIIFFFFSTAIVAGNNRYYNYSIYFFDSPKKSWYR